MYTNIGRTNEEVLYCQYKKKWFIILRKLEQKWYWTATFRSLCFATVSLYQLPAVICIFSSSISETLFLIYCLFFFWSGAFFFVCLSRSEFCNESMGNGLLLVSCLNWWWQGKFFSYLCLHKGRSILGEAQWQQHTDVSATDMRREVLQEHGTDFIPKAKLHNLRMFFSFLPETLFAWANVESTLLESVHSTNIFQPTWNVPPGLLCYPPSWWEVPFD